MPVVSQKKLKQLLVREVLTQFALAKRLSPGQFDDLIHRALDERRFDVAAAADSFACHMNPEIASDWAREFETAGTAPHIFATAHQESAPSEEKYGGLTKADFDRLPAETRLKIANQVEAARRARKN